MKHIIKIIGVLGAVGIVGLISSYLWVIFVVGFPAETLIGLGWLAETKQPASLQANKPNERDVTTQAAKERDEIMAASLNEGFPDAPEDVRQIAKMIIEGKVPTAEELMELPQEALNQSYSRPFPKDQPLFGHTLLRQAVISRNLEAAKILISVGADPFFNQSEMAFMAVNMNTPPPDGEMVYYDDYRIGVSFLKLWFESGGQPNVRNERYGYDDLLSATPMDNIEGILLLLDKGANPWAEYEVHLSVNNTGSGPFYSESFFEFNANPSVSSSELCFRIALKGYYRGGPQSIIDKIVKSYERAATQYIGTSGPDNLAVVWGLQKVIPLVYEQMGVAPSGAVAELLKMKVPDDIGGFFLGPGEIRSADSHNDQRVSNFNQYGIEKWDGQ